MIVRWGLAQAPAVLGDAGIDAPLLVASARWDRERLPFDAAARWTEVPSDRIDDAARLVGDGVVALGGGSAIDLAKAIGAHASRPVVSIPTTYAGAEWTRYFGVRDPGRRMRGGGSGAELAGIVYEPRLTLSLARRETVGTAMNALAHAAEALYAEGHNAAADADALEAARLLARHLPRVVESPRDLEERTRLLEGAMHAGRALAGSMLALGHALAQALGGRYGLPHGALNAICLPAALRFNQAAVPDALGRLGRALGGDPVARTRELAGLGPFERLRDLGVPREELPDVAAAAVERAGAKANPRRVTRDEATELLLSIW